VHIREAKDELIWSNNPTLEDYTPSLGYKEIFTNDNQEDRQWWWKSYGR